MKSIYLINPKSDPQAYFGAEVYAHSGFQGAQLIADLAITTVAAFVPPDFGLRLCDEQIDAVDLDADTDYVGLTGKTSQAARLIELADAFRQRGRVVILGGPFVSLDPDTARAHADILVRGEIEEIAPVLFADLRSGQWKDEYIGTRPDLSLSPMPRWDLYPNHRALLGSVQTSRGCPFECEFCDVPAYAGRKQRHKPPAQVLQELDQLYSLGYRSIFLADDNFTVYRQRAKELLEALKWWNRRQVGGPVGLATQVSIDAARDDELLRLLGEAGFNTVFIGIETPNELSLKETRKRQNVGCDLTEQIGRFLDHHIMVLGGMIVGFDADGPDIFAQQKQFIQGARMPVCSLGALVAPAQTPLLERLSKAGRIIPMRTQSTTTPLSTNIIPHQMSREELLDGLRDLVSDLYSPEAYGDRVISMLDRLGPYLGPSVPQGTRRPPSMNQLNAETSVIIKQLYAMGSQEKKMVSRITAHAFFNKPHTLALASLSLRFYAQIRCVYGMLGLQPTFP